MPTKWINLMRKVAAANLGRLKAPFKLTYVVTKECHSRCQHCNIWQIKRSSTELALKEVEQFAENSPFLSWIDFTGGEPTDRKDFVELVSAFIKHCPNLLLVHFPTNGLKPNRIEAITRELLALKPPRLVVTVSIDGPRRVNDHIRGIPGDFERAVSTLRRLRALPSIGVFAGMTLCQENTSLIEETYAAIRDEIPGFSYRELHVNLPHTSAHFYENSDSSLSITKDMLNAVRAYQLHRGFPLSAFRWLEWMYQKEIKRYLKTGTCPLDCSALFASCFLAQDGRVYPCSIWDKPLGNIRDSGYSLLPLLGSPEAKELRASLLRKECPNCWSPCEAYPTIIANALNLRHWRP
jgi:MoaA/NifB/PqqE/SkfB family radical SAM enzyme